MARTWCARADRGTYTAAFRQGACVAVGWNDLVDPLVGHWGTIPIEFQEKLGLKPGLVLAQ